MMSLLKRPPKDVGESCTGPLFHLVVVLWYEKDIVHTKCFELAQVSL